MNAIQPSRPPVQPRETRQVATRQKNNQRRQNRHPYRGMLLENTAKLFANVTLSALAMYGLAQLFPYLWSQQQKWQEISTEVKQAEGRVYTLRKDFSRYFDPRQTDSVMKEQSNLLEPGQRQVFWQNKPTK
jgi:hypothetical protein